MHKQVCTDTHTTSTRNHSGVQGEHVAHESICNKPQCIYLDDSFNQINVFNEHKSNSLYMYSPYQRQTSKGKRVHLGFVLLNIITGLSKIITKGGKTLKGLWCTLRASSYVHRYFCKGTFCLGSSSIFNQLFLRSIKKTHKESLVFYLSFISSLLDLYYGFSTVDSHMHVLALIVTFLCVFSHSANVVPHQPKKHVQEDLYWTGMHLKKYQSQRD